MVRGHRNRGGADAGGLSREGRNAQLIGLPCGSDGCARGARALNDAISIYVADAPLASAFVARWCVGAKADTAGGVFRVREDEPEPRIGAGLHRTT